MKWEEGNTRFNTLSRCYNSSRALGLRIVGSHLTTDAVYILLRAKWRVRQKINQGKMYSTVLSALLSFRNWIKHESRFRLSERCSRRSNGAAKNSDPRLQDQQRTLILRRGFTYEMSKCLDSTALQLVQCYHSAEVQTEKGKDS